MKKHLYKGNRLKWKTLKEVKKEKIIINSFKFKKLLIKNEDNNNLLIK